MLNYYTDPHESVKLTLLIQTFSLSAVMIYIILIPFDVFASVRHFDKLFQYHDPYFNFDINITIYNLYFVCYIVMIYNCFIGLPFSYFYA